MVRPKNGVAPEQRAAGLVGVEHSDRVTLVEGDLLQEDAGIDDVIIRQHANTVDLFIHAAAIVKFEDKYSQQHLEVNVNGTRRALTVARRLAVPLAYHVSTAYTTGTSMESYERLHPAGTKFFNGYERSKWMTEKHVAAEMDAGLRTAIFRPSIIIGDSQTGEADTNLALYGFMHCVRRFIGSSSPATGSSHRLRANPETRLNFVAVDVVCRNLMLAMSQGVQGGIFHVTDPHGVSVKSMLESLCTSLGTHANALVADPGLTLDQMTGPELRLDGLVQPFLPYLNNGPRFHRTNTDSLFDTVGTTFPETDSAALKSAMQTYASRRLEPLTEAA